MFEIKDDFIIKINDKRVCKVTIYRISDSVIDSAGAANSLGILYEQKWFLFETLQSNVKLLQRIAEWFVINTPLCYKATVMIDDRCEASYVESDKLPER